MEAATQMEMEVHIVMQRRIATILAAPPYKHPEQRLWKPTESKRPHNELKTGNGNIQNSSSEGIQEICTYCGHYGHVTKMCYQKFGLCYHYGKPL